MNAARMIEQANRSERMNERMSEHTIRLHIDGGNAYGDLTVTGFATDRTALEVAFGFADVLRERFPGAEVTAALVEPSESP